MRQKALQVLFVCDGNAARAVMAEAMLKNHAKKYEAYSAGSAMPGPTHPLVVQALRSMGVSTRGLAHRSWEAFAHAAAPQFDWVITMFDDACSDAYPVLNGHPLFVNWQIEDPARWMGSFAQKLEKFLEVAQNLQTRVEQMLSLSTESMDRRSLKAALERIGELETECV